MITDLLADRSSRPLDMSTHLDSQKPASHSIPMSLAQAPKEAGTTSAPGGLWRQAFDTDSTIATQTLLDRAIVAAIRTMPPTIQSSAMTPLRWVWGIASAYYLTHFYPPLLKEAAQRFAAEGREDLGQWAMQKAREERGHDQLALLDIQSMGYKAEAVVEILVPPAAVNLINYLTHSVRSPNPIGCVGYSYTMERLATGIKKNHIRSIKSILPRDTYATRCLHTHSSVGSDVKHAEETAVMIAGLNSEERNRIAIACYETALLFLSSPKGDDIPDKELQRVLQPLRLHTSANES